jgi:lipid-A-disaccharide synthase
VNLILGFESVRELVQYDLNEKNLISELTKVLPGGEKREKLLADYSSLKEKLGPSGASNRVAAEMVRELKGEIK